MKHLIEVENIKCGGCINSIKNALTKIEGVSEVSIDKETETIEVESSTEREEIIKILSNLGYPEKGNNTLLKKAKSYISCAIGKMN